MKDTWVKKGFVVSVIFLFIGVAVAPSITFNVVKASNDNDLVEVTTQACGIKGFGNTTVKLTKQQYQNLEQYLVDFRAKLNQTTTREEAVPIFKDAVVELNKYGLLPKGMSVEQAQRLVVGVEQDKKIMTLFGKIKPNYLNNLRFNLFCLITGETDNTLFQTVSRAFINICPPFRFFGFIPSIIKIFFPFSLFDVIGLGGSSYVSGIHPANGWVNTIGLTGSKNWNGSFYGGITNFFVSEPFSFLTSLILYDTGVIGFTGFHYYTNLFSGHASYIGSALFVRIDAPPE